MPKSRKKILVIAGTRPEAIKMAPVFKVLSADSSFETKFCSTGQHREMLRQVLGFFGIVPDFDLDVMTPGQTLAGLTGAILSKSDQLLAELKPDAVLVQGDTTTVFSVALAAFYHKIPVGHVEAGLRTGLRYSPWPEEMNRLLAGRIASWHFAPTARAREALLRENIAEKDVFLTGNTVIDALHLALKTIDDAGAAHDFSFLDPSRRMILVTGHRRENFGDGFLEICRAIRTLASRGDVEIIYPVHLNPNVQKPVRELLSDLENVHLLPPAEYPVFIQMLRRSDLVLTDSGGVQEEAPALGKPVVVMRDTTERPEAVESGNAVLAGAHADRIVDSVTRILDDPRVYRAMSEAANPYGDGHASERIADALSTTAWE